MDNRGGSDLDATLALLGIELGSALLEDKLIKTSSALRKLVEPVFYIIFLKKFS